VFVSLVLFSAYALSTTGPSVLYTRRPAPMCCAAVSQFTSQTPAADRVQHDAARQRDRDQLLAPLFATLASLVFLKEPVGAARWVALVIGFVGVLIVTNPAARPSRSRALMRFGNALLFGTVTAGVRGMRRRSRPRR